MWLTGFDAPSCSTVYLDKPMRNHTLMQTIARANRVFPGKHSGLIVDYANVFASLEKALAIYAQGQGRRDAGARQAAAGRGAAAGRRRGHRLLPASHGVDLAEIEALPAGSLEPPDADRRRRERADLAGPASQGLPGARADGSYALYQAVKPDPAVTRVRRPRRLPATSSRQRSGSAQATDRRTSRP